MWCNKIYLNVVESNVLSARSIKQSLASSGLNAEPHSQKDRLFYDFYDFFSVCEKD